MEIGDGLKQIREENHLTQEELGFRLGVSRQSISSWENNKSLPFSGRRAEERQAFSF